MSNVRLGKLNGVGLRWGRTGKVTLLMFTILQLQSEGQIIVTHTFTGKRSWVMEILDLKKSTSVRR